MAKNGTYLRVLGYGRRERGEGGQRGCQGCGVVKLRADVRNFLTVKHQLILFAVQVIDMIERVL